MKFRSDLNLETSSEHLRNINELCNDTKCNGKCRSCPITEITDALLEHLLKIK